MPPAIACEAAKSWLETVTFWMNGGNRSSRLHFDGGDFMMQQLDGSKEFLLVDPLHSAYLYNDHDSDYGDMK